MEQQDRIGKIIEALANFAFRRQNKKITKKNFAKAVVPAILGLYNVFKTQKVVCLHLDEVNRVNGRIRELEAKVAENETIDQRYYERYKQDPPFYYMTRHMMQLIIDDVVSKEDIVVSAKMAVKHMEEKNQALLKEGNNEEASERKCKQAETCIEPYEKCRSYGMPVCPKPYKEKGLTNEETNKEEDICTASQEDCKEGNCPTDGFCTEGCPEEEPEEEPEEAFEFQTRNSQT
ncbi:MAG: hypothetical protein KAS30_01630 [Candidatus Diapherotrites archaeon]|nr:hypothetical protein [Candidatus Diapherotrites archaeon]